MYTHTPPANELKNEVDRYVAAKQLLDNFIVNSIVEKRNETDSQQSSNTSFGGYRTTTVIDSYGSESTGIRIEFKSNNLKLLPSQLKTVNWLIKAHYHHSNALLADEYGLSNTISLLAFFSFINKSMFTKTKILVVTSKERLRHWNSLANKWTNLITLVFNDPNLDEGLEQLKRWGLCYFDITLMGRITLRNRLYTFDLMLTTPEAIWADKDATLSKIPFVQIVVDEAHRPEHLAVLSKFVCKRVILKTNDPLPNNLSILK